METQDCSPGAAERMTEAEAEVLDPRAWLKSAQEFIHRYDLENNDGDGTYLSGAEDDPVLVLRPVVLVVFQLLPLDAHSHWSQLLVHPKVIGML